jgi:hypothetical protein
MTDVRIVQGENVWRVLRTDRDGASADEIRSSAAGNYLKWALAPANTTAEPWEAIPTGDGEWTIGAARPVQMLVVSHDRPALPPGVLLGDRQTSLADVTPTVRAERPWWILLRFYWRAPSTTIPWPSLQVGTFGGRNRVHSGADWTLDRAIALAGKSDLAEDDRNWSDRQVERAEQAVKSVFSGAGKVVAVVAGVGLAGLVLYALTRPRSAR